MEENTKVDSRIAKIRVSSGSDYKDVMVRQDQKYFDYIPSVKNLKAVSGPGRIFLSWDLPEEDNFSHVIIKFIKGGETIEIKLPPGTTEYTVLELKAEDGEYSFTVQSYDKENDPGQIGQVTMAASKLVALRFEKNLDTQWVPFYLRTQDNQTTKLKVGSLEYDEGNQISVKFGIDESLLTDYNSANNTNYIILPSNAYSLPQDFIYNSEDYFQDLLLNINISLLEDRTVYALPLTITEAINSEVSEIMNSTLIVYYVEDLQGWYTVDKLPKSSEGGYANNPDPQTRRRYVKRIGTTRWVTGYQFNQYATSEDHDNMSDWYKQFINIDPDTKQITATQEYFATKAHESYYDFDDNTFYMIYQLVEWGGWWGAEKMHSRSLKRELD